MVGWPSLTQISGAIQNPWQTLGDPELKQGQVAVYQDRGRRGMPVVSSGNYASVYRISCQSKTYAVRCFTRAVDGQGKRYTELDTYLKSKPSQVFVGFEYLENEILVAGARYPIVKMEWVNGKPLDIFVRDNLGSPKALTDIAARWREVMISLRSAGIAHNDLQHGNVMVQENRSIRLVDYDSMFLPQYGGQESPENGHPNFQHPLKTSKNYNKSIDNFPALVIYVSLLAIAADPGLFNKFYNDDNLIFRKVDYADPANSACFQALKNNPDNTVRQLVARLEQYCSLPVDSAPELEETLKQLPNAVPPVPAPPAAPPARPAAPWPGVSLFSNAIQNPLHTFGDWELKQGQLAVYESGGRKGMPVVSSGNFAAVYQISGQSRSHAVRCFTRTVNDQRDRYTQLDDYLKSTHPPAFVEFEYLENGIRVAGTWYPVVKMEWVNGKPLDKFVRDNLDSPSTLTGIAARWRGVVSSLRALNIAHNDLQHGNVMVQEDRSIRLVDYDAMFLPQYSGQDSPENGHQNFQHPLKTSKNYNERIDNFPALVIYVSLRAIAADPGLFNKFYNDDNLIFRKVDYADPANSACFQALKNNPDDTVRQLVARLEQYCSLPVDSVPELEEILKQPPSSAPNGTPAPNSAPVPAPPPTGSAYRDLLQSGQRTAPTSEQKLVALTCRGCGQTSPSDLIYCENPNCIAALQTGHRFCAGCGSRNPPNAVYCPECGRAA